MPCPQVSFRFKQSSHAFQYPRRTFSNSGSKSQYYRPGSQYQRYQIPRNLWQRWAARPTFYYEVGGIGLCFGGVYIYNLETVPISGRRRFNIVSEQMENQAGTQAYRETLNQFRGRILSSNDKRVAQVRRVLEKLVQSSNLGNQQWTLTVIDDETANAFVLPGGHVMVFTGILPICRDDAGLAAVLGHEIAHNVAHHSAEKMSRVWFVPLAVVLLAVTVGVPDFLSQTVLNLALELPSSRQQESEADQIGLMIMAESCYDPESAIEFWGRMEKSEHGGSPPQFLSTHPSHHNRQLAIQQLLPKAMSKFDESGCALTSRSAQQFQRFNELVNEAEF